MAMHLEKNRVLVLIIDYEVGEDAFWYGRLLLIVQTEMAVYTSSLIVLTADV